jgi:hypothetical protein
MGILNQLERTGSNYNIFQGSVPDFAWRDQKNTFKILANDNES